MSSLVSVEAGVRLRREEACRAMSSTADWWYSGDNQKHWRGCTPSLEGGGGGVM